MFQDMDRKAIMFFECAFVATNSGDFVQHTSNGGGAQLISEFGYWCLGCVGHNVNHINNV